MIIYPFNGMISTKQLKREEIGEIRSLALTLKNKINKNHGGIIKSIVIAPKGTYCPHLCPYCYQSYMKEKERLLDINVFENKLHEISAKYKLIDDLQIKFMGGTIDDTDLVPYINISKSFFKNKKYLNFAFTFDLLYKDINMPIKALEQVKDYSTLVYITIDAGSKNTRVSGYNVKKKELLERALYIARKFPNVKFAIRSNISLLTAPDKIIDDLYPFIDQQNTMLVFASVKHDKLAPTAKNIDDVVYALATKFKLATFGNAIAVRPFVFTKKLIRLNADIFIYNPLINQCMLRYKSVIGIGPDYVTPCVLHYFKYKSLDDIQYPEYSYTYRDKITRIHECPYIESLYPGYKYPGLDRFTYHFMNIIAKNLEDGLPIWIDINDIFNTEKYLQI